jgi:small-conductance mechanosensitive channel
MSDLFSSDNSPYLTAITIAIVAVVLALALQILVKVLLKRNDPGNLEDGGTTRYRIFDAIDGPIILLVLVIGGTSAVAVALKHWQSGINLDTDIALLAQRTGSVIAIAVVSFMLARVVNVLFAWYLTTFAENTATRLDDQLLPPVRRLTPLVIYSIALLLALAVFDIAITPLLATLGIGGIAIALAAQPTLSNYFAGTYVISEGEIHVGDFIEIEGGPSGYVEAISWRSTKVRSFFNNLIIIPNSMMAENMITNYSRPAPAINVIVNCGVSYSSDLQQVQDIAITAATELAIESEHAVTNSEPSFGFDTFGDSNIDFWVFIQATDRIGAWYLKSDLIKLIHQRFNDAGIAINYPIRHLVVDEKEIADTGATTAPEKIVEFVRNG